MTAPLSAYADPMQRETAYRLLRRARQARDLYRAACETNNASLVDYRSAEYVAAQTAANHARQALYGSAH